MSWVTDEYPDYAHAVHAAVVRLACLHSGLQATLLRLLICHLSLCRAATASERGWLAGATGDVLDVLDAGKESGTPHLPQVCTLYLGVNGCGIKRC